MYIPTHFRPADGDVQQLLAAPGAADLITMTEQGMVATLLPLLFDSPSPERPHGALVGHLARNNEQWHLPVIGEALVIVRGQDGYITPSWYATKAEHGRVVPTWNYVTAHVYGQLVVHDDPVWLETLVRRLTDGHEAGRSKPWSVDDAPPRYIAGQLRAIVGVELVITRVQAKFKLSQNRSADDIRGVIDGLTDDGRPSFARDLAGANSVAQPAPDES